MTFRTKLYIKKKKKKRFAIGSGGVLSRPLLTSDFEVEDMLFVV